MMKKARGKNSGLLPNSLKIISSCLKTVSTNASTVVRSAGASVASSVSAAADDHKDQVTWAGFDSLELSPTTIKPVLLLGYQNGFQVIDVEDASNFNELVSKRDDPVTFLQMLPFPVKSDGNNDGFSSSHPLLLVVSEDKATRLSLGQNHGRLVGYGRDGSMESQLMNSLPSAVRFYSLRSNCYVQVLRFSSAVLMVRCSPKIIAVGLQTQIYCIDALTLENKFTVLTYPIPQFGGQGTRGVNIGYGPMAVGSRWLAYASKSSLVSNTGRLSPKNLSPSISPSTSPGSGGSMTRYAVESSKNLAAGLINLGDMGYRRFSKYCPELLPDGSNSPGNAGMVAVKDVASRAIISQFRAHNSPISALCFDPSGTLLVTASIHGNNINIYRIMPSCVCSGSGNQSYDWSSSHVHLYNLHRGITTAIIQDICFSHYSQWVAIVSSKGTCHIFVLSPFGGSSSLFPIPSPPWWFTSFSPPPAPPPPPPPVTLSVVCRIKNHTSGILNSLGNASTFSSGKAYVPSGAVAAVFHNSKTSTGFRDVHSNSNCLEHLLVYTPSGYVVQHQLLPSLGVEKTSNIGSKTQSNAQDEDSGVKVEALQWWDVCRKSDSPERGESVLGNSTSVKASGVYLSKAEVQISSGRLPIWQIPKIRIYAMSSSIQERFEGGEHDIEKVPSHEVEIKRKELLPVFDHFHGVKSNWNNDRGLFGGRYVNNAPSLEMNQGRDRFPEEAIISHSKPASLSSTESSDGGSSRRMENFLDLDQMNIEKYIASTTRIHFPPKHYKNPNFDVPTRFVIEGAPPLNHEEVAQRPKPEDEGEEDGLLGAMFEFSEEG